MTREEFKLNILNKDIWVRITIICITIVSVYMILPIFFLLIVLQIGFTLLFAKQQDSIKTFCDHVCNYIVLVVKYASFNSDSKPFPFGDFLIKKD